MELAPCKPECLVTHDLVAVEVFGSDASAIGKDTNAVGLDSLATLDRSECGVDVERKWRAVSGGDSKNIFLDGEARVDVTDREDRSVGVATVPEVEVTAEREVLGQNVGVGVGFDPVSPR